MKKISLVVFMVLAALLMGCSSVKAPKANLADHDEDHNIPAIDHRDRLLADGYYEGRNGRGGGDGGEDKRHVFQRFSSFKRA